VLRQSEVARQLGGSALPVRVWPARWQQGGTEAARRHGCRISSSPPSSRPCPAGATANGFTGELWTLDRIALMIQRLTGGRHHPAWVWALLCHRLGWSVQRPRRRAAERDQAAIDHWDAERWPRMLQTPNGPKPA
jgi:transposase